MFENVTMEQIFEWFPEATADIRAEIEDPHYANRRHGSRGTSQAGCQGPICKKAERDRSRARNEKIAKRDGREYTPYGRQYDRDDLIDYAAKWGEMQLLKRRMDALMAS